MAYKKFSTVKATALASSMTSGDTTVNLVDGSTYPDPAVGGNGPYTVLIGYGSDREEICTVTAKPSTNQLTVTRGQDGSSATAKNAGDVVVHGVSKRDWEDLLPLAGGTLTGALTLPGTPTNGLHAATKQYVDDADALLAPKASPTFTGTPAAPTAAADTNTTQVATTAFVVGQAGSATPLADTIAGAVGTSPKFARQDHVHPNAALDAFATYTPTLNQGASTNIAKTVNYAAYIRIGDLVICSVRLTVTAAGSAGSYVWVSLPVTPAHDGLVIGSGQLTDSSVDKYPSVMLSLTTGPGVRFMRADVSQPAASGTGVGNDPAMTLASGDTLSFTVMYEAA